jgi:rRNA-processing protein FCF1
MEADSTRRRTDVSSSSDKEREALKLAMLALIDTNVLLHYRRLEEIDWLDLTGVSGLTIVIPALVLRELDKHKDCHPNRRLKKRAQAVVADIGRKFSESFTCNLRSGVTAKLATDEPSISFEEHRLRTDVNDDYLIAALIQEREKQGGSTEIALISADIGITMKARQRGFRVIAPPSEARIPDEVDPSERKIQELEAQLRQIKAAMPNLAIVFQDDSSVLNATIHQAAPLPPEFAEWPLKNVKSKYRLLDGKGRPDRSTNPKSLAELVDLSNSLMGPSSEQIQAYNSALEGFYSEYAEYVQEMISYKDSCRRQIKLSLKLSNSGQIPAQDIDVHMHFPNGFTLIEKRQAPSPPSPPSPPREPGLFGIGRELARIRITEPLIPVLSSVRKPCPEPNVSSPTIRQTNSYDFRQHIQRIKHGYTADLAELIVQFEGGAAVHPFEIEYSIGAANVPTQTQGKLTVLVSLGPPRQSDRSVRALKELFGTP